MDVFSDHSAVTGWFDIPMDLPPQHFWPMPAKIPWSSVDVPAWQQSPHVPPAHNQFTGTGTSYYHELGRCYEDSFDGFTIAPLRPGLLPAHRGRCQHLHPQDRPFQPPLLKPSRHGEALPASDFLGRINHRWFTQLRRLQSLLHNLRRGCDNPTAIEYRLLTWEAIKKAKGFQNGFCSWWATRPITTAAACGVFPVTLPTVTTMEAIYTDFHANYKALESWNVRQRCAILRARRAEHLKEAFHDITHREKAPLTHLTISEETNIIYVDPTTWTVTTDKDILEDGSSTWLLEDTKAVVKRVEPFTYQISTDLLLCPGQQLAHGRSLTNPADILSHIEHFWQARWSRNPEVDASTWQRVLAFAQAHVPRNSFTISELSLPAWDQVNKRYKGSAARGPDGLDHLDLRLMPDSFKDQILLLLDSVERGAPWPEQLTKGFCHPLPKHDAASAVGHYRPIVIYPMIYRSWGALRANSLIRQLGDKLPDGVRGFLPHREAGDLWHSAQALVECALQQHTPLVGCVSDICKAFEHIPRQPLFQVAAHLGIPRKVLRPWANFLATSERRFLVQGHIGNGLQSTSGMPEGCSLSVVAMLLIDWLWDVYQSVFSPRTIAQSYVDNVELIGKEVGHIIGGHICMEEYFNLWSLSLDKEKTYFWATASSDRSQLRKFSHRVALQQADLGGAMSYCARKSMGSQRARLEALDDLWMRLRRSWAPTTHKHLILVQAFWAKAFHAIGITLLPFTEVTKLRTKAVRALGHGHAGANPGLRLGLLCGDVTVDPGGYQLIRVFQDFKRFMAKQPHLLELWFSFVQHYDGTLFSGPFSKLLEQCDLIHWQVKEPPFVTDHLGLPIDLLQEPWPALRVRLCDAWRQRLSREVGHRKDYAGLVGIRWPPSRSEGRLSVLDVARINSLREGAFLTGEHQGRFDMVKGQKCACGALDTMQHRCIECPRLAAVHRKHPWAVERWQDHPRALVEHLLPSALPQERPLRHQLYHQQDLGHTHFEPVPNTHHDLFTDGSCLSPTRPALACAAWAVVSFNHEATLAASPLAGLQQDIDRAELHAVLCAVSWLVRHRCHGTVWSDSAYATCGLAALLSDRAADTPATNSDLWENLRFQLDAAPDGLIQVQHVPGHMQVNSDSPCLDEWLATWNGHADTAAKQAHGLRPPAFWNLWCEYKAAFDDSCIAVDRFRCLHLDVAAALQDNTYVEVEAPAEEAPRAPLRPCTVGGDWAEELPINWQSMWSISEHATRFGRTFAINLVSWLQQQHSRDPTSVQLSWLELAMAVFLFCGAHPSPTATHTGEQWLDAQMAPPTAGQITVAGRVRYIRGLVKALASFFACDCIFVSGLDRSFLRIHPPLQGLVLTMSRDSLTAIDEAFGRFTCKRPIRKGNDLCRPF